MADPWRVLVVDDSALSREALRHALESNPGLKVVGDAATGEEAIAQVRSLQPDLVTMDLQMPGMGGLKAIEVIMSERPTPLVVISERSSTLGVDPNYEAISRGALELVPKSSIFGGDPLDVKAFAGRMVRLVAETRGQKVERAGPLPTIPISIEPPLLVGVGASTGGPRALAKLLSELPRDFPLPIAIVQHMAEDFFDSFVRFLGDSSRRSVVKATNGAWLTAGGVFVAPPRQEMFIKDNLTVKLLPPPPGSLISPSVDSLFFSMATALKGRAIGVLLTGMGDDGAQGLLRMRRMGARTIAQDSASCAVFGMPKVAVELGAAESVLSLDAIAGKILELVKPIRSGLSPLPQPAPVAAAPAPPKARKRVLVVDDDPNALASAKRVLEGGGYEVTTLDNPLMLAGTLRRASADLVLLECELKTMGGVVVMRALREHGLGRVPVFLYSSLDESTLRTRSNECGALGYIRKGSPTLLRELNAFLGGSAIH